MQNVGIDLAISKVGLTGLAKALGNITPPGVAKWRRAGVPLERCVRVEQVSGVPCESLRNDVTWHRDATGQVTGYTTPVATAEPRAA